MAPRVTVVGLWHLGCTFAACLAAAGVRVTGTDPDPRTVEGLRQARPPVDEPGLADLVHDGLSAGALRFEADGTAAVRDADLLWVTFDTPVNERDEADVAWVRRETERLLPALRGGAVVV